MSELEDTQSEDTQLKTATNKFYEIIGSWPVYALEDKLLEMILADYNTQFTSTEIEAPPVDDFVELALK